MPTEAGTGERCPRAEGCQGVRGAGGGGGPAHTFISHTSGPGAGREYISIALSRQVGGNMLGPP